MRYGFLFVPVIVLIFSCSPSHYYYIVRHAEKEATGKDPALSKAGGKRAEALRELLRTKHISFIFTSPALRAVSTAKPSAELFHLLPATYVPQPDTAFILRLRSLEKNTLIVGHSNTVDDIVNMLYGSRVVPGDLPETEYDNLFIIKKKGKRLSFEKTKYGTATP